VEQRAKNILSANWRAQLSTIELKLGTRRGARRASHRGCAHSRVR
jgi:hypothetical protein